MATRPNPHAFRRFRPYTRFQVEVTGNGENVATFKPTRPARLAFVLVKVDDPRGLDACGMEIRSTGQKGQTFLAPDDNAQDRSPPPLSMLVPPDLFRADEYPSLVDGLDVGPGSSDMPTFDVVLQNLTGDAPYTVDLYFFAYPDGHC